MVFEKKIFELNQVFSYLVYQIRDMKPTGQLDAVLNFMRNEPQVWGVHPLHTQLSAQQYEISIQRLDSIVRTLCKDGYIDILPHTHNNGDFMYSQEGINLSGYKINFEGEVLIERGGYSVVISENEFLKKNQEQLEKMNFYLTLILTIGTSIPAIYYIMEIANHFWSIYPY